MSTAAKRLRDAGFDERQAEAAVSMVRYATGADRDALATKADLAGFATKADLHREIGTLRSELRWMLSFLAALILAMAARLFGII